ncbi:MAG: iron-containing alcohol dehydrogenase, partial [Deltaproteobacteria bacterium]|nr:iron-containing alcohol dehydrogenase [Deltaproteobacteria bacterium]
QQLVAACLAGAAFSNAQVGLVHAMAHTVGARNGIHHGLANSICMPHVIRFNGPMCHDAYNAVSVAFGLSPSRDAQETAARLADALFDFAAAAGLSTSLKAEGVPENALSDLAEATLSDGAIVYNGRPAFDVEELKPIWRAAWEGK